MRFAFFKSPEPAIPLERSDWFQFLHAESLEDDSINHDAPDTYVNCTLQKHAEQNGYVPILTERLTSEHASILGCITAMLRVIDSRDVAHVRYQCHTLYQKLDAHMKKENMFLFKYLLELYSHDDEVLSDIRKARETGKRVFAGVKRFCVAYQRSVNPDTLPAMKGGLVILERVLVQQFEQEEADLFPLYMAN